MVDKELTGNKELQDGVSNQSEPLMIWVCPCRWYTNGGDNQVDLIVIDQGLHGLANLVCN
jgi:hypothetical protein